MTRTEEQTRAIESAEPSLCVTAGAGSGKTRVLIERLQRLLDPLGGNVPFESLVAITFTNKAASEMRSRLRAAAHAMPEEARANRDFWRGLERKLDAARIDTIDAFCLKLLKENALELGLDPEFVLLNDAQQVMLQNEVVSQALNGLLEDDSGPAMRLAVHFGLEPLRAMLEQMLKQRALTEAALEDWRGLDLEATEAKARETARSIFLELVTHPSFRANLEKLRDELAHREGQCMVKGDKRDEARLAAMAALADILSVSNLDDWTGASGKLLSIGLHGGSKNNWASEDAMKAVKAAIDAAKALVKGKVPVEDPEITRQSAVFIQDLSALYDAVTGAIDAEKERRQAFYFEDIMRKTVEVLANNANLRRRVAGGIRHLLIDEFQDTDPRQLVIANLLHREEPGPDLFIVGDAKQSIYRFRGAEVSVFDDARSSAHEIRMNRNHRTVPEVLEFVNEFFAKSRALEAVEAPYEPMETWRPRTQETRVEFWLPAFEKDPSADEGRKAEAELLATRLKVMCELQPVTIGDGGEQRKANYGDAALLMRSINRVSIYERALRNADVPYYLVAGKGFYERQEVIDIRNLLAAVADPCDEVSLAGCLRSPIAGLSDDALLALVQEHRTLAAAFANGAMPDDFPERTAWNRARALVAELQKESERPLADFVTLALDRCAYEAMLLPLPLGESRAANVRKVAELAAEFAAVEGATLRRFIAYMDEVAAKEIQEGDAGIQREGTNAVAIMTIHKSKGLEFPIVCLPDLGRAAKHGGGERVAVHRAHGVGVNPTGHDGTPAKDYLYTALNAVRTEEEKAEHARILYVGMTRAQDWLLLSAGKQNVKGSWFELLEDEYHLSGRKDGDIVGGERWKAVVKRVATKWSVAPRPWLQPEPVDTEAALRRARPIERVVPHGRSVSVSALLNAMEGGGDFDEHAEYAPRTGGKHALIDGKLRGSIVHRLLERWDFETAADEAVDAVLREEFPMPVGDALRRDMTAIAAFVRDSELGGPLRDAASQRELGFAFRLADDALVLGTFDAVLPDGTLVDWKTGRFDPGAHARYERQLQLYAAAAEALGHPAPAAMLVYVEDGRIEPVDISKAAIDGTLALARNALGALRTGGIAVTGET